MMNTMKLFKLTALFIFLAAMIYDTALAAGDGDDFHPNHLAVNFGGASLDGKTSEFIGIDYFRFRESGWGIGGYYEETFGDFDLQVWGLVLSKKFGHGFKFNVGPGVERKIRKDKTYYLFRTQLVYDWHFGHWSVGPVATVDFIQNGNTTYYLSVAVGYGW